MTINCEKTFDSNDVEREVVSDSQQVHEQDVTSWRKNGAFPNWVDGGNESRVRSLMATPNENRCRARWAHGGPGLLDSFAGRCSCLQRFIVTGGVSLARTNPHGCCYHPLSSFFTDYFAY